MLISKWKQEKELGGSPLPALSLLPPSAGHTFTTTFNYGVNYPKLATSNTLQRIEQLTDTQLTVNTVSGTIDVGAESRDACVLAISKLTVLLKSLRPCYLISHIFLGEESGESQVVLRKILDVRKKYFETTLLKNHTTAQVNDFRYGELHKAIVARCTILDPKKNIYASAKKQKYEPVTSEDDAALDDRDWVNFTYHGIGGRKEPPAAVQSKPKPAIVSPTLPATEPEAQPAFPLVKTTAEIDEWAQTLPTTTPFSAEFEIPPVVVEESNWGNLQRYPQVSRHILDDENPILNTPSLLDPLSLIYLDDQPQSSSYLEMLDIQESQQQVSEPSTREYRKTMDQKAPKPNGRSGKLPLPSPPRQKLKPVLSRQLFQELRQANPDFNDMLEAVKGFQGEIRIQAYFGRILLRNVPNQFVAKKDSDRSYNRDWLSQKILPNATTTFTTIVTTIPQDAHYLVDLECLDGTGERLWEAKPFEWSVFYEFRYSLRGTNKSFTIEMDGETTSTRTFTPADLGRIYVNGTRRHFDVRLGVDGCIDVSGQHAELVDSIKHSLFIA